MKKTSKTKKKKPVKSVGDAMNALMGQAVSAARAECGKPSPKKKIIIEFTGAPIHVPTAEIEVSSGFDMGVNEEESAMKELVEHAEFKFFELKKGRFKFINVGTIPYKTYVTTKRINSTVKIRPTTKYTVGLVSGKTIIAGLTEIPDRRTGQVEFEVKLPVSIRTKSISVRLYYIDGCNITIDYNREYKFDKTTTLKKGDKFKFVIDLHLDDTNPKR